MGEMGVLLWNNKTAEILYSPDYEKDIVYISELGQDAYQLFTSIDVGTEVALQKADKSKLRLLVNKLKIGQHIECEAVIQE